MLSRSCPFLLVWPNIMPTWLSVYSHDLCFLEQDLQICLFSFVCSPGSASFLCAVVYGSNVMTTGQVMEETCVGEYQYKFSVFNREHRAVSLAADSVIQVGVLCLCGFATFCLGRWVGNWGMQGGVGTCAYPTQADSLTGRRKRCSLMLLLSMALQKIGGALVGQWASNCFGVLFRAEQACGLAPLLLATHGHKAALHGRGSKLG